ncbi:DUF3810 domain-containing protein [Clostridium sp. E02]|uniref:DUF3810 domain-containing protein n=1 Tax=Clostridium sp. E02 TaxID=2487134 RepID=UPI000F5350D4|nr:DUF3810 domain-containing protein [Clostridium sp. E02]
MEDKKRRLDPMLLIASGLMFVSALLVQILARSVPGFGDWYALHVYPLLVGSVGRLSGQVPFALIEIISYVLILVIFVDMIRHFREWKRGLIRFGFLMTGFFFLFTFQCGINYYRKPFSHSSGLEVRKSSKKELARLCLKLTDEVNGLVEQKLQITDQKVMRMESREAMSKLGDSYPQLAGYYPPPKPLIWSTFFSIQELCGQYSPFTVEATYNRFMPAYNIPHTQCHELSHLRGFMREDEANFIGYLACIGSDDPYFNYSGYLTGWIYATNALAETDWTAYQEVCDLLDERAWKDLRKNNEFWSQYQGKASEVSNRLNDTYLKINSQSDGVESYGRVVDLMLAYDRTKELGTCQQENNNSQELCYD